MALFSEHSARLAADAARRQAGHRGHRLDRFKREAGRPTAVCGCGMYVFVEREGRGYVWGWGRLPGFPGRLEQHVDAFTVLTGGPA
jgi:hypothetical protein